jgi:hypothetical protein
MDFPLRISDDALAWTRAMPPKKGSFQGTDFEAKHSEKP